jgi:hypothetical protein
MPEMSVGVPDSVRTSLEILRAHRRMMGMAGDEQGPTEQRIAKVIAAFAEAGTKWTLVGAHAVGALTEPRATEDFDFVIEERKLKRVLERLEEVFGPLMTTDVGAAVRVLNLDIDLIRSTTHPLFKRALDETQAAQAWRIPVPELLIALKYLASVSPWRGIDRRRQDVLDLIRVYKAGEGRLDRRRMIALAGEVFPGADREFERLLERVDRDEPITL